MTDNYASSVLSELKDTIKRQSAEIEDLQKRLSAQQSSSPASTGGPTKVEPASASATGQGGHAGHGPPGESLDELSLYLSKPFYKIATRRVGWLGLFLVSLSLTAIIMSGFEHTLSRQLELAYFVPLLAGHGGNTGGQAVGTVLSAISAGIVTLNDAPKVISKEALSGLTIGIVLGSMVAPIAHFGMGITAHVATVIFCTLPLVSTIAATLGSTIPFACLALGLDPSVIAAPAMTSFVDVSGLLSYFLIAGKVFSHFGVEL
jgi:Mg/Co/Ni transporter MgtE